MIHTVSASMPELVCSCRSSEGPRGLTGAGGASEAGASGAAEAGSGEGGGVGGGDGASMMSGSPTAATPTADTVSPSASDARLELARTCSWTST